MYKNILFGLISKNHRRIHNIKDNVATVNGFNVMLKWFQNEILKCLALLFLIKLEMNAK